MTIIDIEDLKYKLDKLPCKPHLFAARLFALQLLTGRKLDELIDIKIVQPLSKVTEFQGSQIQYRFTDENIRVSELIDNAISVYYDIAKSYLNNINKLEVSHDEKIQKMMELKEIPRHPDAEELYWPEKRPYKEPKTDMEKLWEYICAEVTFRPNFDYQETLFFIADFLYAYGYDIKSRMGQVILAEFTANAEDDLYGDFDRLTYCSKCGKEIILEFSLECANQVLGYRVLCLKCSQALEKLIYEWLLEDEK